MVGVYIAVASIALTVAIVNASFLARMARTMKVRNMHLAANTAQLEKHNLLLSAIGDVLIALYPDHQGPEQPSRQHKLFAIKRFEDAKAAIAEFPTAVGE